MSRTVRTLDLFRTGVAGAAAATPAAAPAAASAARVRGLSRCTGPAVLVRGSRPAVSRR